MARALMLASVALLSWFTARNLRRPGSALLAPGAMRNLTVVAVNDGMPISSQALVMAGDAEQLPELASGLGAVKWHLSQPDEARPEAP